MNEINISQELIEDSILLTHPDVALQLRKVGRAIFVLCKNEDQALVFAFLSSALTHYFEQSASVDILEISLSVSRTMAGSPIERSLILRIKLRNGSLLLLNQTDDLYVAQPYIGCEPSGSLISPSRKWGIHDRGYLEQMLLTERLVECLEAFGGEARHLLFTIWKDFELHVRCSKPCRGRITIAGELMAFSVRPFCDGQFIFDYV